ncbi:MAG: hypothetical protein HW383_171, partial [Candidatus Magasanikbacteria bacterium]|nr:hypothetical protein [Candidatus Magasanikbacteria bacterium]
MHRHVRHHAERSGALNGFGHLALGRIARSRIPAVER